MLFLGNYKFALSSSIMGCYLFDWKHLNHFNQ